MARSSGIWWRESKGAYYTTINSRQIRLSENEADAEEKFAQLTGSDLAGDTSAAAEICDAFLDHIEENRPKKTYNNYSHFLNSFCKSFGKVLVCELVRGHATKWLAAHKEWNSSTKARSGSILKICFRWAVEEGLISKNPFATLKKEGELRRERILTADEWQQIFLTAREPFRTFLLAVRLSGCRPGEVRKVTSQMVDLEDGCWVIPVHKTRGKTKEPRIVWLSPELLALTKKQLEQGPGFLFRNNVDGQWSEGSVVGAFDRLRKHVFDSVRKRMGLGKDVVLYSLRHSYATEALETLDVATVAELLGHKGVGTLMKNYAHLRKRGSHMRAAAAKAIGCASASSPAASPAGTPPGALPKCG